MLHFPPICAAFLPVHTCLMIHCCCRVSCSSTGAAFTARSARACCPHVHFVTCILAWCASPSHSCLSRMPISCPSCPHAAPSAVGLMLPPAKRPRQEDDSWVGGRGGLEGWPIVMILLQWPGDENRNQRRMRPALCLCFLFLSQSCCHFKLPSIQAIEARGSTQTVR